MRRSQMGVRTRETYMIVIKNKQRKIHVDMPWLQAKAHLMLECAGYPDFDLGILLTTNATIKKYNKTYRKKDKATDILSFPYHNTLKPGKTIIVHDPEDKNLGDIIISLEYALRESGKTWGRTFEKHLVCLLAHGIAHVLGHDHKTAQQEKIMLLFENKLVSDSRRC